jgi:hypothetical protein
MFEDQIYWSALMLSHFSLIFLLKFWKSSVKNLLESDKLAERSVLEMNVIMELLEVYLKTKYFQADDKFFHKKESMAIGSSLSPAASSIFKGHFEN